MKFEKATLTNLNEIMKIENAGFNTAEAGSRENYQERIQTLVDNFIVAKDETNEVLGFICGPAVEERFINDSMYHKTPVEIDSGGHQMVLTIAISPDHRGEGIGSKLLSQFETNAKKLNRKSIALNCLEDRIPFYEKNGFINLGMSDSNHGDETWYNMEKVI